MFRDDDNRSKPIHHRLSNKNNRLFSSDKHEPNYTQIITTYEPTYDEN
jgi:hypothetical protein